PTSTSPHFLFARPASPSPPHSFPTRRSSDLLAGEQMVPRSQHREVRQRAGAHAARQEQRRVRALEQRELLAEIDLIGVVAVPSIDRKSTRLNSSHVSISYAVFCFKKKRPREL